MVELMLCREVPWWHLVNPTVHDNHQMAASHDILNVKFTNFTE